MSGERVTAEQIAAVGMPVDEALEVVFDLCSIMVAVMAEKPGALVKVLGPLAGGIDPEKLSNAMLMLAFVRQELSTE